MKPIVLLLVLLALTACNNARQARAKPRTGSAAAAAMTLSPETLAEERRRSVRDETEARAKSFERQGYTAVDARALAEVEYFRSGK
ncbi:MAG: hypothetical protein ABIZ81_01590 [Opitutaceae bacterium]